MQQNLKSCGGAVIGVWGFRLPPRLPPGFGDAAGGFGVGDGLDRVVPQFALFREGDAAFVQRFAQGSNFSASASSFRALSNSRAALA